MHPRNRHQSRYNLSELAKTTPELERFIFINDYGTETIDFSDANAVKILNKALLKSQYGIQHWDLPQDFLCPPIPGRADYIHAAADLFTENRKLHVLDVGVGANCIYPLLGSVEYDWSFVGSDVSERALTFASTILEKNKLGKQIELRLQKNKKHIFRDIVLPGDAFDLTICNPPFHESAEEAYAGTQRKWRNLGKTPEKKLNFGGKENELWYPGGEKAFILTMIKESKFFAKQVSLFTTLVSKEKNLRPLESAVKALGGQSDVIPMGQGVKKSRILAWSFP